MRIAGGGGSRLLLQRFGTVCWSVVNEDRAQLGCRPDQYRADRGYASDGRTFVGIRNYA